MEKQQWLYLNTVCNHVCLSWPLAVLWWDDPKQVHDMDFPLYVSALTRKVLQGPFFCKSSFLTTVSKIHLICVTTASPFCLLYFIQLYTIRPSESVRLLFTVCFVILFSRRIRIATLFLTYKILPESFFDPVSAVQFVSSASLLSAII